MLDYFLVRHGDNPVGLYVALTLGLLCDFLGKLTPRLPSLLAYVGINDEGGD